MNLQKKLKETRKILKNFSTYPQSYITYSVPKEKTELQNEAVLCFQLQSK